MKKRTPVLQQETVPAHVRRHLTSQPQSGLSIPQYCIKHSISSWSFYQWRKRYQLKLNTSSTGSRLSFTEIGAFEYSGCICDVRFPSGITVSVRRGADRDELSKVFSILADSSRC